MDNLEQKFIEEELFEEAEKKVKEINSKKIEIDLNDLPY